MRVKTGTVRRQGHKKILAQAKGFWMTRSKRYKVAKQAVMHAGQYAYNGRRIRRRDLRQLWIVRLNAALRPFETSYSKFIQALKLKNIQLNRKTLSEIAISDPDTFRKIFTFTTSK
ncbi:50S ribosomal protein L20 [Candidatus Shapirobacteria bacterium RBG_13_44_7]|uniref:Large ribosomal subunit protein bL20 n=1 Tax=Candidatus Shapirobacteria bacterium RBG_13_44_7 TaxID=1802149 RepID=A0A1F7SKQ7_9BACT|nr:MAG: 50S ribosomal protein L20 [Candidatus Shapirobacteria bacterium RBG_13_44_7]